MTINLSKDSFDKWVEFVFDHPVTPTAWHFEASWEYECDSEILIKYMTRLFNTPVLLINKYSYEQIDQGLWFIPGPNGFMWAILDDKVNWLDRKRCVDSIQNLFSNLYSKYKIGTSAYMWWDSFITYCAYNEKNLGTELNVLEAVISVLKEILKQSSDVSKRSAEHGIEHIIKLAKSTNNIFIKQLVIKELGQEAKASDFE